MNSFLRTFVALLAGCLAGAGARAHVGPLDPSFGDGGMRNYGFQAVNGGINDRASVACAGADGTLTMSGIASSANRIVTARLLPNGDYDPSFGVEGRVSVALPGSYNHFVPGLCQPDGNLVMARATTAPDGEQNLQILRVLKASGELDPGFGSGGIVSLDLDQYTPGLGAQEMPLGVNALANGDIAVSGMTALAAGGSRGFVVVLASNGSVRAARALDDIVSAYATTVVDAPDGNLWAFGSNGRVSGAYRALLNRQNLAWQGVLEYVAVPDDSLRVGAGRVVDAGTVVLAAIGVRGNVQGDQAKLVVFRASQVSALTLPTARLDNETLYVSSQAGRQGVTVLAGRRVLYGADAQVVEAAPEAGIYLGMARIGRQPGGDAIETAFGQNGAAIAAFRSSAPACSGVAATHAYARLTLWQARPVLLGAVSQPCSGGTGGFDYLVASVLSDYLFADGLQ